MEGFYLFIYFIIFFLPPEDEPFGRPERTDVWAAGGDQMGRKDKGSRGVLGGEIFFFWAGYRAAGEIRELFLGGLQSIFF